MKIYSQLYAAAANSPVALTDFKAFIRQYSSHEDTILTTILASAVTKGEEYCQHSMEKQSRIAFVRGQPAFELELDRGPVRSITSVKYRAVDGTLTTLDPSTYRLENDILVPVGGNQWPTVNESYIGSFQVIYVAGHADQTVSPKVALSENLKVAIFLLGQAVTDRREDCEKAAYCILDSVRVGQGV